jgi:hypothetical protein
MALLSPQKNNVRKTMYKTKMIKGGDQVTLIVSPNFQETEITITCVNSPAKIEISAPKLVKIFKGGNK